MSGFKMSPRPRAKLKPNAQLIPADLRKLTQWVCWVYAYRDGDWTKIPMQPNGACASSTDPKTWSSFKTVLAGYENGGFDGIGFVTCDRDPFVLIDLDHVFDLKTATFEPWAEAIVNAAIKDGAYVELSPSGTGVHIIGRGPKGVTHKTAQVELYTTARFLTISRSIFNGVPRRLGSLKHSLPITLTRIAETKAASPTAPKGNPIDSPRAKTGKSPYPAHWTDADILAVALKSKQGPKLRRLLNGDYAEYANDSSAGEFALASALGFWFHLDADRVEGVMREHGPYREKWDSARPRDKWGKQQKNYTFIRYTVEWALAAGNQCHYGQDHRVGIDSAWRSSRARHLRVTQFKGVAQ
jgi:putative DNA primase/helicase